MNIFGLLWKNVRNGAATLRFPACAPAPERLRGMVRFDQTRCTGCAVCRFRCTSGAIQFQPAGRQFTWSYNPAQCTFCGRCVEGCKDHALSQEPGSPPAYFCSGELAVSYTLDRKTPAAKADPSPDASHATAGGAS
jgi:formate hydrogenlyase subunit 6/NADH:ubiquinone oxidoreductase subunit I